MIDIFAINSSVIKILVLLPYKHSLSENRFSEGKNYYLSPFILSNNSNRFGFYKAQGIVKDVFCLNWIRIANVIDFISV